MSLPIVTDGMMMMMMMDPRDYFNLIEGHHDSFIVFSVP